MRVQTGQRFDSCCIQSKNNCLVNMESFSGGQMRLHHSLMASSSGPLRPPGNLMRHNVGEEAEKEGGPQKAFPDT